MVGKIATLLLQLRVLLFGFFLDRNVGVGVFPQGKEFFVGGERPGRGRRRPPGRRDDKV
jgi:UPF0716 family protein affecting phage T7 exclusion